MSSTPDHENATRCANHWAVGAWANLETGEGKNKANLARCYLALADENALLREALRQMVKWDSAEMPTPLYVVNDARALLAPPPTTETPE